MPPHREANATLVARKILLTCDKIKRGPHLYSTKGRHNAQYMTVEGKKAPAFAVIDITLQWVKG